MIASQQHWYSSVKYVWKEDTSTGQLRHVYGKMRGHHCNRQTIRETSADKINKWLEWANVYGEDVAQKMVLEKEENTDMYDAMIKGIDILKRLNEVRTKEFFQEEATNFFNNLRPFQKYLYDVTKTTPNDRNIYWVYDKVGNTGKTIFMNTYGKLNPDTTCILSNGKTTDMLHAAGHKHKRTVVMVDIPRTTQKKEKFKGEEETNDCFNYGAIEMLKNGDITDYKYNSRHIPGVVPHLFIFANYAPTVEKLSYDRWRIGKVDPTDHTFKLYAVDRHGNEVEIYDPVADLKKNDRGKNTYNKLQAVLKEPREKKRPLSEDESSDDDDEPCNKKLKIDE